MNATIENVTGVDIQASDLPGAPEPGAPSAQQASPTRSAPGLSHSVGRRRHTSKIGRLPLEIRNFINQAMADGAPYSDIAVQVEERGHAGISRKNLSDWARTGFVEWRQEQRELARAVEPQAVTRVLAARVHPENRLAQTQLNDYLLGFMSQRALESLDSPELFQRLRADPDKLTRYLATLAKLQAESTQHVQTEMKWQSDRQSNYEENNPVTKRAEEESERRSRERLGLD